MTSNRPPTTSMSSPTTLSSATVTISTTASPQTVLIKGKRYRQRPLGPAPFASFEDLSDEVRIIKNEFLILFLFISRLKQFLIFFEF